MAQIKQEILSRLKTEEPLQYAIAAGMGKKFRTVEKWIRENNPMLATEAVVLILKKETGLNGHEILEEVKP